MRKKAEYVLVEATFIVVLPGGGRASAGRRARRPRRKPRREERAARRDAPIPRDCHPPDLSDREYARALRRANRNAEARGRRDHGRDLAEREAL